MTNENSYKGVLKNVGDMVANEPLGKYVKCALTAIWEAESQIMMEPRSGKHGFCNSPLNLKKKIRVKLPNLLVY